MKIVKTANATRAADVLRAYSIKTDSIDEPSEVWVIDLVSDLMHMCDRDELKFDVLLKIARNHYQSESEPCL